MLMNEHVFVYTRSYFYVGRTAFLTCVAACFAGMANTANAPNKAKAAKKYIPPVVEPVVSFINPTAKGPQNPPRLPTEFMMAMPTAAVPSLKNIFGRVQKVPTNA